MGKLRKLLIICLAFSIFLGSSSPVFADQVTKPSGMAMAADIPIRVISCGVIGLGLVLFVPAAFFTAIAPKGSTKDAWDTLVVEPVKFTFARPMGCFSE